MFITCNNKLWQVHQGVLPPIFPFLEKPCWRVRIVKQVIATSNEFWKEKLRYRRMEEELLNSAVSLFSPLSVTLLLLSLFGRDSIPIEYGTPLFPCQFFFPHSSES